MCVCVRSPYCVCLFVCVCVVYSPVCHHCLSLSQIEEIRSSIDKIDESVTQAKKLYSTILSAPTSEQSKHHHSIPLSLSLVISLLSHPLYFPFFPFHIVHPLWLVDTSMFTTSLFFSLSLCSPETQDDLEAVTNDIKKAAGTARNKLKSKSFLPL